MKENKKASTAKILRDKRIFTFGEAAEYLSVFYPEYSEDDMDWSIAQARNRSEEDIDRQKRR